MVKKTEALAVRPKNGNTLIPAQGQRIMESMSGEIPEWAKQNRPGRGGKVFTYIPHGYVADKLNQTFGPFWSWKLLPVANGKPYDIVDYQDGGKDAHEVVTVGVLTIHIFANDGSLLETIERVGEGGKVWERNTTFADALQASSSDAFKRAAFRLGRTFGLQLYYDDEERQGEYLARLNPQPPKTVGQLLTRMTEENVADDEFFQVIGYDVSNVKERDVPEIWEALVKSRNHE